MNQVILEPPTVKKWKIPSITLPCSVFPPSDLTLSLSGENMSKWSKHCIIERLRLLRHSCKKETIWSMQQHFFLLPFKHFGAEFQWRIWKDKTRSHWVKEIEDRWYSALSCRVFCVRFYPTCSSSTQCHVYQIIQRTMKSWFSMVHVNSRWDWKARDAIKANTRVI